MTDEEQKNFIKNVPVCHNCLEEKDGVCTADDKQEQIADKAMQHNCPIHKFDSRGAGDTVAKVIHKITGAKPCGGCKKRIVVINKLLPYKQD